MPSQVLKDGKLAIRVVEGSLSLIEIEGLSRLSENYIKSRLPKLNQPLKTNDLTQALNELQQDPLIKEINGELKVLATGKNVLSLSVKESKPIKTELRFANTFSPTVGSLGGEIIIKHQNLLGFGDRFLGSYTLTEGLDKYNIDYSFPFNTSGGILALSYNNANSELIEEAISAFDINADFEAYKLIVQQPAIKNQAEELAFFLKIESLRSETFIAQNISFPFVDGLDDGISRITPLRLGQEYSRRGNSNLLAARSEFSIGLDVLDATKNDTGIDGIFWSWQGNIQWIKAFDSQGQWLFRTNLLTQLSPDRLLPLEQLTIGGFGSVRGYRQNLLVGDNGVVAIVESQLPIVQSRNLGNIYFVPFVDLGTVWNKRSDSQDSQSETLASVGLQIDYRVKNFLNARIFYGIPLVEPNNFESSTVEERWGFSIVVTPLQF